MTPNCASASARTAAGLAMGTSMHTHISASLVRLGDGGVWLERSAADDYYSHSASHHNQQANPGRPSLLTSAPRMPVLQQLASSTSREAWDFESTERLCPPPQLVSAICAACPGSRKQTWAQVRRWKKFTLVQCTIAKIHIPENYFARSSGASSEKKSWSSPWAGTITSACICF